MQLTTNYQLISSFSLTYGEMRTYAKYSSQSTENNTTTYQIKQTYYCSISGGYVGFDRATAVLDGTERAYTSYTRMYSGETVIQELNRVIEHNQDGSSPTKNIATSWNASFGGSGSTNVNITFPNIARYPMLTGADNFNDEGNPKITYSTILGFSGATVQACIANTTGQVIYAPYRQVVVANGSYTFELTDAERTALRNATPNSNTLNVRFYLMTTTTGGTSYYSYIERTMSIVNATPYFWVTYQDTNSTTIAITNDDQKIIQNNSTLQLIITDAEAMKGATLNNIKVTINGVTTTTPINSSTLTIDIGTVNLAITTIIPIVLTDSRGNTVQAGLEVEILPYQLPTALITLNRKQNYYTETDITPDVTYSSLDGNNTLTIQYRTKKTSESSYGSYANLTNNTTTTFNADNTFAWDVQVLLTDRIGSTTYNLVLGVGLPILFIDRRLRSVGVNCFPANSNSLEINGKTILDLIYPIGSIYISVNATNPSTLFGGTWEAISQGRCLMGAGEVQNNNDNWCGITRQGDWTAYAGNMGGEVTHTLTINEMPTHNHGTSGYFGGDGQEHPLSWLSTTSGNAIGYNYMNNNGGGQAHNNMPPYLVVYMWKRVS
jgi:hypothetical protein